MMLITEYFNVRTRGSWQHGFRKHKRVQYSIAVFFGATPGCFGAFAAVAMFSHQTVIFGAPAAAMIATSGDEAIVMFALFPEKALLLTAIPIIIAFVIGWLTDFIFAKRRSVKFDKYCQFELHDPAYCDVIPEDSFIRQWLLLAIVRAFSCAILLIFAPGILAGVFGPDVWGWKQIALLIFGIIGFFIATYASDHFLRVHHWRHVIQKHLPGIFLRTAGTLLVAYVIIGHVSPKNFLQANTFFVLFPAAIIGIISQSGLYLIFTTFYGQRLSPFIVLLTGSVVQDGHGMLPLLAHSRRKFLLARAINFAVGLAIGLIIYCVGYFI